MAIVYVSTTGSNTPPYDTKAKAATSILTGLGLMTPGDEMRVDHTHAESRTVNTTLSPGGGASGTRTLPYKVTSWNFTTDVYAAGARIYMSTNNNLTITVWGFAIHWGMEYDAGNTGTTNDINVGNGTSHAVIFRNCIIRWGDNFTCTNANTLFDSCTLDFTRTTSNPILAGADSVAIRLRNCTVIGSGTEGVLSSPNDGSYVEAVDCDFSALTAQPWFWTPGTSTFASRSCRIIRCALPSGVPLIQSGANTDEAADPAVVFEGCGVGTTGVTYAPMMLTHSWNKYGTFQAVETHYRASGASQDVMNGRPFAIEIQPSTNAVEGFLPLRVPLATINIPAQVTPSGGYQGIRASTAPLGPFTTPVSLTADGDSTWSGTNVGTKQKLTVLLPDGVTYYTVFVASAFTLTDHDAYLEVSSPDEFEGAVRGWLCVCKSNPATPIYADPLPVLST